MQQLGTYDAIPWYRVSVEYADNYIDTIQPVPDGQPPELWHADIKELRRKLEAAFPPFAPESDYFFYGTSPANRLLCLEVANHEMLNAELVGRVSSALNSLERIYAIDICNYFYLSTASGDRYPDFYIFVEQERIIAWTEAEALPAALGVVNEE